MGQLFVPGIKDIILSDVDRLVARNANGGLSVAAAHIILLGANAGHNLGALSDVIALGRNTLAAGIVDPTLSGSIAIGGNAAAGLLTTVGSGELFANVVIGRNALQLATGGASANVILGDGAVQNGVGGGGGNYSANVVAGVQAAQNILFSNGAPFDHNVILGFRAARGSGAATSLLNCIVIGSRACEAYSNSMDNSVVIGFNAAQGLRGANNTFVGGTVGAAATTGANNTLMGSGANVRAGTHNAVFGDGAGVSDGSNNVILGSRVAAIQAASDCVIIGNQAGVFTGLTDTGAQFLIEQQGSSVIYGQFFGASGGSVVLGNSVAVNRTLPGTNIVQLMNGTATGNPVGGGMLYGVAAELRWRNAAGQDTFLSYGAGFTVATLPAGAAAFAGLRTYVTNALAPVFGAPVAAGGAITIPVFFDGAAWIVG